MTNESEADQAAREHRTAARANQLEANRVFRAARDTALANGKTPTEAEQIAKQAEEAWWNK
jgi:putative intracellular protease/amidase